MQLIRLPEVLQMVSVGKTTWYSMVKDNKAPAPKKLGPRSVAWNKQEIENWINELPLNTTNQAGSNSDSQQIDAQSVN
jgi:prophage regulatory protein